MLSVLSNADAVAHYTAPYSFVRLSWILPSVVSAAFFPLLSRRLRTDPAEAEQLYFRVVRIFVLLSVVLALLLAVAAPLLLPLVFGEKYRVAVPVLEVLAWTTVCTFGNYIFWYGIIVAHEERAALVVQLAGLGVNVAANAVAIPLWGPTGAAAALVLSELFVVVGQARIVHRRLFPVPVAALVAKPLLAAALAVPVGVLLARESAAAGALAGAALYAGVLLLLRYVRPEEWRPLTGLVLRVVSKRTY
jgi:O-antigen/teichoic acid export membrane protein